MRVAINDVDPALAAAAVSELRAEGLTALDVPGSVARSYDEPGSGQERGCELPRL